MQRVVAIFIVLIFIMSVIFWISHSAALGADSGAGCSSCHSDALDSGQGQDFVHAPFRSGACSACHINAAEGPSAQAQELEESEIAAVDVRWIYEYFEPVRSLFVPLSADEVKNMLVVEIWDQCRQKHQHIVPLPPLAQTSILPSSPSSEVVLHEIEIRRDPMRTDTVVVQCSAVVPVQGKVYLSRNNEPPLAIDVAPGFHAEVSVRIAGLESSSRYSLYFQATDMAGTVQKSPVQIFVPAQLPQQTSPAPAAECALNAEVHLYRATLAGEDSYMLKLRANQPVTLSVGMLKAQADVEGAAARRDGVDSEIWSAHPQMAGAYYTNYASCRPCHADSFGPMSHPVDIVPGAHMRVNPELPLLEDGRISCMTCHDVHAGDDPYRLRLGSRQKLCNGCHERY